MRRKTMARVLLAVALCAAPSTALAQRRRGGRGGNQQPAQTQPAGGEQPAAGGESGGSMTFTTDEAQNPDAGQTPPAGETPPADTGASSGGGGLEGIGGADVRAMRRPLRESIFAVQQIYALRNRRFEIQPTFAISLNDPYVSHNGIDLALNFWITNVLAVGVNFMFNQGLNSRSDVDFRVARSAGLVVPVNEYQMLGALNFTYVPVYGKFLMFNRFIFHWDLFVNAGVGFMRTRPIPVVDPEARTFDYDWRFPMFRAGGGLRVFVNRWFGIIGEIQNYIYLEQTENTTIAERDNPVPPGSQPIMGTRQDPATWRGPLLLTDNVMIQVGITIFLPFSVSYRLQR